MILRRITEHVRTQNWFAVGLDFGIVVIGVFVGIQVSNWNQERVGAEQQQRYLERLESDFTSIQQRILRDKLAEYDRMADIHLEVFRSTVAQNSAQIPIVYRHYKVATALDEEALSGIKIEVFSYDLEAMRNDPQFEVAVMILGTNARNNYGVRRLQGSLTEEILGLLKARDRS